MSLCHDRFEPLQVIVPVPRRLDDVFELRGEETIANVVGKVVGRLPLNAEDRRDPRFDVPPLGQEVGLVSVGLCQCDRRSGSFGPQQ